MDKKIIKEEKIYKEIINYKYKGVNYLSIEELIGFISLTINSRVFFKNNIDIKLFLEYVFQKEYPLYLYNSRPLLIGRISSELIYLHNKDNVEKLNEIKIRVINYYDEKIQFNKNISNKIKENINTENANHKLSKWLERL